MIPLYRQAAPRSGRDREGDHAWHDPFGARGERTSSRAGLAGTCLGRMAQPRRGRYLYASGTAGTASAPPLSVRSALLVLQAARILSLLFLGLLGAAGA